MAKHRGAKLVPPKPEPEKTQAFEVIEESNVQRQKEEPVLTELDPEFECSRCHESMELHSSFDKLMYACNSCSFILKCT